MGPTEIRWHPTVDSPFAPWLPVLTMHGWWPLTSGRECQEGTTVNSMCHGAELRPVHRSCSYLSITATMLQFAVFLCMTGMCLLAWTWTHTTFFAIVFLYHKSTCNSPLMGQSHFNKPQILKTMGQLLRGHVEHVTAVRAQTPTPHFTDGEVWGPASTWPHGHMAERKGIIIHAAVFWL